MDDAGRLSERTYVLAPDVEDVELRCSQCGRSIPGGYPFIPVRRDIVDDTPSVEGLPISDAVCVYCDIVTI